MKTSLNQSDRRRSAAPRQFFLAIVLTLLTLPGWARDVNEIVTVVQIHSNRITLTMELAFPTALRLAGQTPTREIPAEPQFENAQPQLRELAGSFFDFTAGNHRIPATRTNVQLGVEDHIHLHIEYAVTAHRPLRLIPQGLARTEPTYPYGVTLTVLDLVNQTVLGQATLFGAGESAEFPPRPEAEAAVDLAGTAVPQAEREDGAPPVKVTVTNLVSLSRPQPQPGLAEHAPIILILLVGMLAFVFWIRRRE
jgi:hypothetical protein